MYHCIYGHLREECAAVGLRVVHREELPVAVQHVEEVDNEFAQDGRDVHASMHYQVNEW